MIHTINAFDGKSSIKVPTEILDADVLDATVLDTVLDSVLNSDAVAIDAELVTQLTNSPVSDPIVAQKHLKQHAPKQHAQKHSSIGRAKRHLTVTKTITVVPIKSAPSASQTANAADTNTADTNTTDTNTAVQSVVISRNTQTSSQLTNYVVNSDITTYLQPYPSMLFSAPTLNRPRRSPSIRLPWLELGGGLAAFSIVSGVVVIDGLKQAKLSPTKPTAQLTPPKLTSIPNSNPLGASQMSVAELMNSGRSLPVPNSAMNFPAQQIASNSGNFGALSMPSGNMKTVGLSQISTTPIATNSATNSTLPKPTTAPLTPRRPIAMPETQVTTSQALPSPRLPVRTQPISQQPIQQPVQQPVLQQPPVNSSAFPPQEIPEATIVVPVAPALPNTSANTADPLTYNRPDLIQVPTPPQNPSVSPSNINSSDAASSVLAPVQLEPGLSPLTLKAKKTVLIPQTKEEMANSQEVILDPNMLINQPAMLQPTIQATMIPMMPPGSEESLRLEVSKL